jgi:ATP-dependent RNA circularization protein (DNA/RNA ligase family)
MDQYHKIQTVWLRDPDNRYKTLLKGEWAKPEFEYLQNTDWVWTEKIDGTNIRISCNGQDMVFQGKTDNAQIPAFLYQRLQEMFRVPRFTEIFPDSSDDDVVLFGEGYGAKIQKGGGNYISNGCGFILFDVKVGDMWLRREDVEDIAGKLLTPIVPVIGNGTLAQAIGTVRNGFNSCIAEITHPAEGLVMRPKVEMSNRMGQRIITKIKTKDF